MQKTAVFWPQKADFCEIQKNGPVQIYVLTQRSYIPNFIKIRSLVLPLSSGRTDGRTDARTDRTDLIGPPEKISGDQLVELGGDNCIWYLGLFHVKIVNFSFLTLHDVIIDVIFCHFS